MVIYTVEEDMGVNVRGILTLKVGLFSTIPRFFFIGNYSKVYMQAEASWLELNKVTNYYYHVNSGSCMVMPAIQYQCFVW